MATNGTPSAMATVSHVCAFCAPPCRNTSCASPSPQTRALTLRAPLSASTGTSRRRTVGAGGGAGRSNSAAFSWKRPNSSYGPLPSAVLVMSPCWQTPSPPAASTSRRVGACQWELVVVGMADAAAIVVVGASVVGGVVGATVVVGADGFAVVVVALVVVVVVAFAVVVVGLIVVVVVADGSG